MSIAYSASWWVIGLSPNSGFSGDGFQTISNMIEGVAIKYFKGLPEDAILVS